MLRVASIFSQILHEIPRTTFESLVGKHGAERCTKGFSCWTQLVAMVFSHLARADSLREICHGLATTSGKLVHLGVGASPCRSTLSYANAHRPAALYEELFYATLERLRQVGHLGHHKPFRFRNKILTLDATTVTLCLDLFPWARYQRSWYLYAVGEPPPAGPSSPGEVQAFMSRVDELLRREHRESYCGIVYADDLERPRFVKIFDPNYLGASCGSSRNPPLPGWTMSLIPPVDLRRKGPLPESRPRWWRAIFDRA